jgi:hypothetical protein
MSSNVSSVLKRTADTCESKELTDKQPFLKAVVDIAKTTPVSEGTVMGKTVKMCDIQNKVIGHHNTFVIDDTMISTNIGLFFAVDHRNYHNRSSSILC